MEVQVRRGKEKTSDHVGGLDRGTKVRVRGDSARV